MSRHLLYPALSVIRDYFEAAPGLVTAGQPTPAQFSLAGAAGFDTVVNLATPDSVSGIPDEDLIVEDAGMKYIAIPVRWQEPTRSDLERFFAVMDGRGPGEGLFIHCIANKRVSAFLYLYRVLIEKAEEHVARADLLAVCTPNERWGAFLFEQLSHADAHPW